MCISTHPASDHQASSTQGLLSVLEKNCQESQQLRVNCAQARQESQQLRANCTQARQESQQLPSGANKRSQKLVQLNSNFRVRESEREPLSSEPIESFLMLIQLQYDSGINLEKIEQLQSNLGTRLAAIEQLQSLVDLLIENPQLFGSSSKIANEPGNETEGKIVLEKFNQLIDEVIIGD